MDNTNGTTEEALKAAEGFKVEGNQLLQEKKYRDAAVMYTRAIELDPDNAVYYSNRSAAYLAMGDERGNALRDAEKCIELRPDWWKGYSRKGAAEHALTRYDAARATYMLGLKLDPDNASLLQAAEDAYAAGQAYSQQLREQAKAKEAMELAQKEQEEKNKESLSTSDTEPADEESALLAEFMNEVESIESKRNCIAKPEPSKDDKTPVDFGTTEGQLVRLLQPHYEWINLNPFRVLMLETDATEEDIKQHYRKISTMVHPDKCRLPQAREAFEEVTKAYNLLLNDDRRQTYIKIITNTHEKVEKERRIQSKKGIKPTETLKEALEKAVIKAFAEMEHRRQNLEKREAAQRRREAEMAENQQQKVADSFKRERSWAEVDRREERVGNWRTFQQDGKKQRKEDKVHGWKEEKRVETPLHGVVEQDEYKRKWK